MIGLLKKILTRSKALSSTLGPVIFETPKVPGQVSGGAYVSVRVKKDLSGDRFLVGCEFKPDAYIGSEASPPTNYINLDTEKAKQLRDDLDQCIAECEQLQSRASQEYSGT